MLNQFKKWFDLTKKHIPSFLCLELQEQFMEKDSYKKKSTSEPFKILLFGKVKMTL